MSITEKETGNPSKRKGDRGEERRRQVIKEETSDRGGKEKKKGDREEKEKRKQ